MRLKDMKNMLIWNTVPDCITYISIKLKSTTVCPYKSNDIISTFQLHNRCAASVNTECTLGQFSNLILPPTAICPAVLDRQRSVTVSTIKNKVIIRAIILLFCLLKEQIMIRIEIASKFKINETFFHWQTGNQPSMHFQITPPSQTCPLLVFINPKSGGRQGDRILRKFQYMLNPRQVYDLSKGGPLEGKYTHNIASYNNRTQQKENQFNPSR